MISRTTNPAVRRYNSVVIGVALFRTAGRNLNDSIYRKLDIIGEAPSSIGILTDDKRRIFFDHSHAEIVTNNIVYAGLTHMNIPVKALEVKEYIGMIDIPSSSVLGDNFASDVNRLIDYLTKNAIPVEEDIDTSINATAIEEPSISYTKKIKRVTELLRESKLSVALMNHLFAYIYVTDIFNISEKSLYEAVIALNSAPGIFLDFRYVKELVASKRPATGYVSRCETIRDLHGLSQIVTDDFVANLPITYHVP